MLSTCVAQAEDSSEMHEASGSILSDDGGGGAAERNE